MRTAVYSFHLETRHLTDPVTIFQAFNDHLLLNGETVFLERQGQERPSLDASETILSISNVFAGPIPKSVDDTIAGNIACIPESIGYTAMKLLAASEKS